MIHVTLDNRDYVLVRRWQSTGLAELVDCETAKILHIPLARLESLPQRFQPVDFSASRFPRFSARHPGFVEKLQALRREDLNKKKVTKRSNKSLVETGQKPPRKTKSELKLENEMAQLAARFAREGKTL